MPLGRSVSSLQAFYILVVCLYRVATKMALRVKLEHCMDIQELIGLYVYTVLVRYTVMVRCTVLDGCTANRCTGCQRVYGLPTIYGLPIGVRVANLRCVG